VSKRFGPIHVRKRLVPRRFRSYDRCSTVELNREICRAARLSRDPRFDGKFFIAVRTTRIFCRPVCPARSPHEENIDYYPSAAGALQAGFRPCLRCRPESWGTPAWDGTSTTVMRALRLIEEGALDGPAESSRAESTGVDALAERLGIGSRHLRRLFLQHLGASPIAVAQAQRLLSAKKLIDETTLPFTAVAIASRYGSIRRFNAAFRATYGRSPRELRRSAKRAPRSSACTLQLRFRPPYDYDALLNFLARRAIAGVEYIHADTYRRTFVLDGEPGWLEVQPRASHALALRIERVRPARLLHVVARVRRTFDLDADPLAIHSSLKRDPLLARFIQARPGLRVPGAWDAFELGIRAILGQQVSVAGASTLTARVAAKYGHPVPFQIEGLTCTFPTAHELVDADLAIGIPASRAEAIREFARAVVSEALVFDLAHDAATCIDRLCAIRGLGPWTAQYIAMRALSDPDAFPAGDLALLRATGMQTPSQLERHAERWRPWRAYAAMHIWQGAQDGTVGLLHMDAKQGRKAAAGGG
jgi:AraC family transcriptional regulator, regulatory protein of adaptative response / DNA-3-methyladenine glycosylase II